MYIIRNLLRYIINAEHCISPTRSVVYHQAAGLDKTGSKVFADGEHIHSLRLKSKLFDLRSGYVNLQHNSLRLCAMFKSAYPQTTKQTCQEDRSVLLAGVARFELTNEGVKVPCLTAWRYPFGTWLL